MGLDEIYDFRRGEISNQAVKGLEQSGLTAVVTLGSECNAVEVHAESEDQALRGLANLISQALGSRNSLWQALALWIPASASVITAVVLAELGVPDLTTGDLRRMASVSSSLLVAGLAGAGIVAALGLRTEGESNRVPGERDEVTPAGSGPKAIGGPRVSRFIRLSQATAGTGVVLSVVITCGGIVAGALTTSSPLADSICIAGLVAAVVQLFAGPISLAIARLGHRPFLVDELVI